MQQELNKIITYFGFAIKSGAVEFGFDNIMQHRKKDIACVIVCNTANPKQTTKMLGKCETFNIPCFLSITNKLEFYLNRNCKFIAITNENLAKPIINSVQHFKNLKRGDF